jgi:hypothetical protein
MFLLGLFNIASPVLGRLGQRLLNVVIIGLELNKNLRGTNNRYKIIYSVLNGQVFLASLIFSKRDRTFPDLRTSQGLILMVGSGSLLNVITKHSSLYFLAVSDEEKGFKHLNLKLKANPIFKVQS